MLFIRKTTFFCLLFSCFKLYSFDFINTHDQRSYLKSLTKKNHYIYHSYSQAREFIYQKIHLKQDDQGHFVKDEYCHKIIRDVSPNHLPDHTDFNIEHTWPQSRFNEQDRKDYQRSDLHHLYPVDSLANQVRGNHIFQNLNDDAQLVRGCPLSKFGQVDGVQAFEPPLDIKGNIARALFYFSIRYDLNISAPEEMVLRIWHYLDPVDDEELLRNSIIEEIQGNRNPFIDNPDFVDLIKDF